MAPLGISLHIGVNQLDRSRYPSCAALRGCENDARGMEALAAAQGFETRLLLGADATVEAVKQAVAGAAARVGNDGIMLVSYSGHGGFVPNRPDVEGIPAGVGLADEEQADQTWCLSDRQMLDDELYRLWVLFAAGARILVISDSCHSGTIIRGVKRRALVARSGARSVLRGGPTLRGTPVLRDGGQGTDPARRLTQHQAMAEFRRNAREYRALQDALWEEPVPPVEASVLQISAAQDWETARDGPEHGLFTRALLDVWADGAFRGSHLEFHARIYKRLQGKQSPQYEKTGVPNPAFEAQRPFTIEPPAAETPSG